MTKANDSLPCWNYPPVESAVPAGQASIAAEARKGAKMNFYVIVRHPSAAPSFKNRWLDNDKPQAITTTPEIGRRCADAIQTGERILVHRCGCRPVNAKPLIVCSVRVTRSVEIRPGTYEVEFSEHQLVGAVPDYKPGKHENSYEL